MKVINKEGVVIFTSIGADLSGANLSGADLSGANLSGANLIGADLIGADLSRANLSGADLSGANLSRADLSGADLSGADLIGADLSRADLLSVSASLVTNGYDVFATPTHLKIGCQFHSWSDWMGFDDRKIEKMDGAKALLFWATWKPVLKGIAESRGWI